MVPQPRYCIRCFTLDSPTGRSSLKTSTHTQLPSSTCTIFRPRVHFPFASVRGANALDMSSAACSSYTLFRMISVQSSTVSFILWRKFYLQTPLSSRIDDNLSRRCSTVARKINTEVDRLQGPFKYAYMCFALNVSMILLLILIAFCAVLLIVATIFSSPILFLFFSLLCLVFGGLIVLMFPWMDRVRSSAHYTAFTFPLILDAWRDVSQFIALLSQDTSIYGTKNVARALRFMLSFEEHLLKSKDLDELVYRLATEDHETFKDYISEWEKSLGADCVVDSLSG